MNVRQVTDDGTELCNTVRITDKAVYMEASTCENQDCVQ